MMSAATDFASLAAENAALRSEIERLHAEIEAIRSASSAGFARGRIKQAPVRVWAWRAEAEDML